MTTSEFVPDVDPVTGERDLDAWLGVWLETRLLVRTGGRTVDLDAIPAGRLSSAIAPLVAPLALVTAWNPRGRSVDARTNRAANVRLRAALDASGIAWRPALGRARDGSWAEPGVAVGGLDEPSAAALGAAWDQLAVYWITDAEVVVLASDGSYRVARRRGAGQAAGRR